MLSSASLAAAAATASNATLAPPGFITHGATVGDDTKCWPAGHAFTRSDWCVGAGYKRIQMADFPTSGSSWLRLLLSYAATEAGKQSPSCAIYSNEAHLGCAQAEGLYCQNEAPGGCDGTMPASALVKTHFPAGGAPSFDKATVESQSSCFAKLVVLVREPLTLLRSNAKRGWGFGEDGSASRRACRPRSCSCSSTRTSASTRSTPSPRS